MNFLRRIIRRVHQWFVMGPRPPLTMRPEVEARLIDAYVQGQAQNDKPHVSTCSMVGTFTYTTYEAEAHGDDCADQMHAQGWTLRAKSPEGIHGGMRYLWVRPGTPSTVEGLREFVVR